MNQEYQNGRLSVAHGRPKDKPQSFRQRDHGKISQCPASLLSFRPVITLAYFCVYSMEA